jgi:hypothetical protein
LVPNRTLSWGEAPLDPLPRHDPVRVEEPLVEAESVPGEPVEQGLTGTQSEPGAQAQSAECPAGTHMDQMRIVGAGSLKEFPHSASVGQGEQIEQRASHSRAFEGEAPEFLCDTAQCCSKCVRVPGIHRVVESFEKCSSRIFQSLTDRTRAESESAKSEIDFSHVLP